MERLFIMEPSRTKRSIHGVEIALLSSDRWLTQSMKFWSKNTLPPDFFSHEKKAPAGFWVLLGNPMFLVC
jgi:hypothetical protein